MTNHCTKQQSDELKEIGFDMPTDYVYQYDGTLVRVDVLNYLNIRMDVATSAPTRSEVLQWAREKHGIDAWVRPYKDPEDIKYYGYETYQVHSYYNCFETHPEAESALVDKIIEILTEQKG